MIAFKRSFVIRSSRYQLQKILVSPVIVGLMILYLTLHISRRCSNLTPRQGLFNSSKDFENFDNVTGTPSGAYIVPNIVHFVRFGNSNMSFMEAVCVLAALKNQKPEKLVIHTDHTKQGGKYWEVVSRHPLAQGVLEIRFHRQPESIFGQELSKSYRLYHAADIARLEVLMAEGGIFLDGDSYIVRSLDPFRRYEMTLGWMTKGGISNQVMIAHKHARFLAVIYNSYRTYNKGSWFYNAGDLPTMILSEKPFLVHRVPRLLAEYGFSHLYGIYQGKSNKWKMHYALHLMTRWEIISVKEGHVLKRLTEDKKNEQNILDENTNIKAMVVDVYPFPASRINSSETMMSST